MERFNEAAAYMPRKHRRRPPRRRQMTGRFNEAAAYMPRKLLIPMVGASQVRRLQ